MQFESITMPNLISPKPATAFPSLRPAFRGRFFPKSDVDAGTIGISADTLQQLCVDLVRLLFCRKVGGQACIFIAFETSAWNL